MLDMYIFTLGDLSERAIHPTRGHDHRLRNTVPVGRRLTSEQAVYADAAMQEDFAVVQHLGGLPPYSPHRAPTSKGALLTMLLQVSLLNSLVDPSGLEWDHLFEAPFWYE